MRFEKKKNLDKKIRNDLDVSLVQSTLSNLVKMMVFNPDDVECKVVSGNSTVLIEIKVNGEDVPKMVGRKGKVSEAFRTIGSVLSGTYDTKFIVNFSEK